jgi:hypothetical protein
VIDQIVCAHEASCEDHSGIAGGSDTTALDRVERDARGMNRIP